jgi:hypothetical protein
MLEVVLVSKLARSACSEFRVALVFCCVHVSHACAAPHLLSGIQGLGC